MVKYAYIREAQDYLINQWGDSGKQVIECAFNEKKENMSMDEFLKHCSACGGNWGGMLLTGIKQLFPTVWEAIPEDMGIFSWACLCYTLLLCGVDTTSE